MVTEEDMVGLAEGIGAEKRTERVAGKGEEDMNYVAGIVEEEDKPIVEVAKKNYINIRVHYSQKGMGGGEGGGLRELSCSHKRN